MNFFWVYNDALVVVCILLVYTPFISLSVFLTLDKTFFYLVEWPQRMDVFWPILYVSDTPTTLECNIIYLYTNKKHTILIAQYIELQNFLYY